MAYSSSFIDPIAQSFYINASEGIFVTSVDIFFASKDDTAPVILQIRNMVNGVPSSIFNIPNGQIVMSAADIVSNEFSTDLETVQSNPTRFTFDVPVYLGGEQEYALVLLTNSDNYNAYVAKTGDFVLGRTDKRILQQPTSGSLFLSQNSTTYTPDQERDLMYRVRGARFNSTSVAKINNKTLTRRPLIDNPLYFDSGSSAVTVYAPNHALSVGDEIYISGLDSNDSSAGIRLSSINGLHNVTKVDGLGFKFELSVDSAANSTFRGGGSSGTVTSNIGFEKAIVQIPTYLPLGTEAKMGAKFTTGHSLVEADQGQGGYGLPNDFIDTPFNTLLIFDDEKLVASEKHETDNMAGEKSFQAEIDLVTASAFVSPVFDVTEMNLETSHNIIDYQDSAISSLLFNTPIKYQSETDAFSGSSLSKHMTIPIALEQPAVGIKFIMSVNRPPESKVDVYYRLLPVGSDEMLNDIPFVLAEPDVEMPTDNNFFKFRDYEYTIGGLGGDLDPFTMFQIKLVLNSRSDAKYPRIRDIRAIALGT